MIELKPCPVCGGEATPLECVSAENAAQHGYVIICSKCIISIGIFASLEEAAEVWNRREGV